MAHLCWDLHQASTALAWRQPCGRFSETSIEVQDREGSVGEMESGRDQVQGERGPVSAGAQYSDYTVVVPSGNHHRGALRTATHLSRSRAPTVGRCTFDTCWNMHSASRDKPMPRGPASSVARRDQLGINPFIRWSLPPTQAGERWSAVRDALHFADIL